MKRIEYIRKMSNTKLAEFLLAEIESGRFKDTFCWNECKYRTAGLGCKNDDCVMSDEETMQGYLESEVRG